MESVKLSEDQREAFETLQNKYAVMRKQHGIAATQLSLAEKEKIRNRLTLAELEKLPDGTATYKAVGKMFLMVPYSSIKEECKNAAEVAEGRIAEFSSQKVALEKNIVEVEAETKQILTAAREQ